MLTLHELTDSKVQLGINKLNSRSPLTESGHNRKDTGVMRWLWRKCFGKLVSCNLIPEGGNRCRISYIDRKLILYLRGIEGKAIAKVFN